MAAIYILNTVTVLREGRDWIQAKYTRIQKNDLY